jgi:hypothetical protein
MDRAAILASACLLIAEECFVEWRQISDEMRHLRFDSVHQRAALEAIPLEGIDLIVRSELDWVIVRPVILTNGPKTNTYRAVIDPRGWTCGFISRAARQCP